MTFQPNSSITEQIANHLSWEIVSGRLRDRDRIQELKLAKELGVSRGSVREALLVLEGRRLVDLVPRRGAAVRALNGQELSEFGEIFSALLTRGLASVSPRTLSRTGAFMEPLCSAAKAQQVEAVLRARDGFLRTALEAQQGSILHSTLEPLLTIASRIGMRASAHGDFDIRDSYRWCSGLTQAMQVRDSEQLEALVNAFVRRECGLAKQVERCVA